MQGGCGNQLSNMCVRKYINILFYVCNQEYIAVMAADTTQLPAGTRFLKLVIVDGGCGGAVPLPIPWAPVPSNQRLLFGELLQLLCRCSFAGTQCTAELCNRSKVREVGARKCFPSRPSCLCSQPNHERTAFGAAPVNYTSKFNNFGTAAVSWPACPALQVESTPG